MQRAVRYSDIRPTELCLHTCTDVLQLFLGKSKVSKSSSHHVYTMKELKTLWTKEHFSLVAVNTPQVPTHFLSAFSLHHQSNHHLKTQDRNKTLNLLDYTFDAQMTQSMSVL